MPANLCGPIGGGVVGRYEIGVVACDGVGGELDAVGGRGEGQACLPELVYEFANGVEGARLGVVREDEVPQLGARDGLARGGGEAEEDREPAGGDVREAGVAEVDGGGAECGMCIIGRRPPPAVATVAAG